MLISPAECVCYESEIGAGAARSPTPIHGTEGLARARGAVRCRPTTTAGTPSARAPSEEPWATPSNPACRVGALIGHHPAPIERYPSPTSSTRLRRGGLARRRQPNTLHAKHGYARSRSARDHESMRAGGDARALRRGQTPRMLGRAVICGYSPRRYYSEPSPVRITQSTSRVRPRTNTAR